MTFVSGLFFRSLHLQEHVSLHSGHRPFICEVCNKSFVRATCLTGTKIIHSDEHLFNVPGNKVNKVNKLMEWLKKGVGKMRGAGCGVRGSRNG